MSTLGDIIALAGAGASGYMAGDKASRDRASEEEEREAKRQERARVKEQNDKAKRVEQDLGAAWMTRAPVANMVKPETADNIDVGQPGTVLEQQGYRVGTPAAGGAPAMASGPVMTDIGQAAQVAQAANAPQARDQRVADVYGGAGMYDKAMAVGDAAQKREVATLAVDEAKRKVAQEAMMRGFVEASRGGPQGIAKFLTDHYHDGNAYEGVAGQGGAFTLVRRDPAGNEIGRQEYKGVDDFIRMEGAGIDPLKWAEGVEKREQVAAKTKLDERQVAVAEKNADTNEKYRQDMASAALKNADTKAANPTRKADHFDEKQWDAVQKIDEPSFVTFERSTPDEFGGPPKITKHDSSDLRLVYRQEINRLRAEGAVAPNEAAAMARETVQKLRDVATVMAERSGGKMTEEQAAKALLTKYQAAAKAAQPAPTPVAAPAAPAAAVPPAAGASMAAPPTRVSKEEQRRLDSDRRTVLNNELAQAAQRVQAATATRDPIAIQRASEDVAALRREISRLPG